MYHGIIPEIKVADYTEYLVFNVKKNKIIETQCYMLEVSATPLH